MQAAPPIVLRDIHRAEMPSLWPPAPGWWLLALALLLAGLAIRWWLKRRRAHRQAVEVLFDTALTASTAGPERVAALSALLRRAARRHHADADTVDGEPWLALLKTGMPAGSFDGEVGRLLLEGSFRRDIDAASLAALQVVARQRFLRWMGVNA